MFNSRALAFLNWNVRVGQLFGIPIHLHISLLFFLFPILSGRGLPVVYMLEYGVLVTLCILLHELGHALTAKRYGLSGIHIMLHGFGGYASSQGARTWKQDLTITLAGPAVTFAIGFLLVGVALLAPPASFEGEAFVQMRLLQYLGYLNLILGVLNLAPTLPFDGGNAVRAIVSRSLGEFKSLRAVGHLGLLVSACMIVFGLVGGQSLVTIFGLIGLFASLGVLLNSGGIRFGEVFADRRARKEEVVFQQRQRDKQQSYLEEVAARARKREEDERLRKLFDVEDGGKSE